MHIFFKKIRRLLLRMRNISDERSRENLCTHFILNNVFHKFVLFMEQKVRVILYIQIG